MTQTATPAPTATPTELQLTYGDRGYAVTYLDGTIVEHGIPTAPQAEERLAFHVAQLAATRAWDAAHPH